MALTKELLIEIRQGFHIPPKPQILEDVDDIISQGDYQMSDVARLIAQDVGLSASVLKIMNSSTYGMNRTISDITQAVCFLGIHEIKALIAASKLRQSFAKNACINLERFWDESFDTASSMLFINKILGNKLLPDMLYSLGLFRDVGIAAMSIKHADYVDVLQQSNSDNSIELVEFEERVYGYNHAIVGFFIASSWHLPKPLCKLILRHHDTDYLLTETNEDLKQMFCVLQVAENLNRDVKRFELSQHFNDNKDLYFEHLGISDADYLDWKDDLYEMVA